MCVLCIKYVVKGRSVVLCGLKFSNYHFLLSRLDENNAGNSNGGQT